MVTHHFGWQAFSIALQWYAWYYAALWYLPCKKDTRRGNIKKHYCFIVSHLIMHTFSLCTLIFLRLQVSFYVKVKLITLRCTVQFFASSQSTPNVSYFDVHSAHVDGSFTWDVLLVQKCLSTFLNIEFFKYEIQVK